VRIECALPDDPALTTALSEHPARYWELELRAETEGIDFVAAFLLPIYAEPGAGAVMSRAA
jgi:hypothetical protein